MGFLCPLVIRCEYGNNTTNGDYIRQIEKDCCLAHCHWKHKENYTSDLKIGQSVLCATKLKKNTLKGDYADTSKRSVNDSVVKLSASIMRELAE